MARHPALEGAPLLIAHRGGSLLAPENTLAAFRTALDTWGADMIELDVHASADGHCVVIHDRTVDRTTDDRGAVAGMTLRRLRELDAGHRFTPDAGATFPFREQDVRIPTIDEVLEAFPDTVITVEVKTGAAQVPLFEAVKRFNARDRVIVAGMFAADRSLFHEYRGPVSASGEEVRRFWVRHRLRMARFARLRADVVQVPEVHGGRRVVTQRFVRDLLRHDVPVHVWTVNDAADMNRLLDWGVEGILTDRPDLLGRVLHERVGRPLTAAHGDPRRSP
jgi:glycerophosphoryl diester phosphodiesterase